MALGLLSLIVIERSLVDAERLAGVYRPLGMAIAAGAAAALVVGWLQPAPWIFALLLGAILSILWVFAANRFLSADAWGEAATPAD